MSILSVFSRDYFQQYFFSELGLENFTQFIILIVDAILTLITWMNTSGDEDMSSKLMSWLPNLIDKFLISLNSSPVSIYF